MAVEGQANMTIKEYLNVLGNFLGVLLELCMGIETLQQIFRTI